MGNIMTIFHQLLLPCHVLAETSGELVEEESVFSTDVFERLRGVTVDVRVFVLREAEYCVGVGAGDAVCWIGD